MSSIARNGRETYSRQSESLFKNCVSVASFVGMFASSSGRLMEGGEGLIHVNFHENGMHGTYQS